MKPVVVADTGPLIALAKLDFLSVLNTLFSSVYIPKNVLNEATRQCERSDAKLIATFASESSIPLDDVETDFVVSLRQYLDDGEIQAINHARDFHCGVLMDEKRGRKIAAQYHIPVIGVVGVLLQAKQQGLISDVKTPLKSLIKKEYRLSDKLVVEALRLAGE